MTERKKVSEKQNKKEQEQEREVRLLFRHMPVFSLKRILDALVLFSFLNSLKK